MNKFFTLNYFTFQPEDVWKQENVLITFNAINFGQRLYRLSNNVKSAFVKLENGL